MFLLKKIATALLMPFPLMVLLLLTGVVLLWLKRRERLAKALVTVATLGLALFGYQPVANLVMEPLEEQHAPLSVTAATVPPRWIVVLGGAHTTAVDLPPNSQLNPSTLARLIEGIRLHRAWPAAKLLLSGGDILGSGSHAALLGRTAVLLGVDPGSIVLEEQSQDTEDEARLVRARVGEESVVLVTAASHMPRAVRLFAKQGVKVLPAPTDFSTRDGSGHHPGGWLPRASQITKVERALHERLGTMWSQLRGRV